MAEEGLFGTATFHLKKISIMFLYGTYNDNIRSESEIYMKLT